MKRSSLREGDGVVDHSPPDNATGRISGSATGQVGGTDHLFRL